MKKFAIGVDIGGSHISCALIDLDRKCILAESMESKKVDNHASADEILHNWAVVLNDKIAAVDKKDILGIGFAMPGPFDYANGIALFERTDKFEKLYGINIKDNLKKLLTIETDLKFMNDATAFAVGESWGGKAVGYKKFIAITLGTGFGSAFIDAGLPVLEGKDVPEFGCVWHLPYKKGIADDYFSTRWFIKQYTEKTGKTVHGVKEIEAQALTDQIAKDLFIEFGNNLGEFLGPWIQKFGAEALVIGGNQVKGYSLFGPALQLSLAHQQINIQIHLSELLEDAALLGSARLLDAPFCEKLQPLLSKM
jgi:glucokinase